MRIKKGDTVKVLSGKDRGKRGKVRSVLLDEHKIIVEKMNIVKKHEKQSKGAKDTGGIVEKELPMPSCKVMVVCPVCDKPTRVGYEINNGKRLRKCKKCSAVW